MTHLVLLSSLLLSISCQLLHAGTKEIVAYDWDSNVFFMNTPHKIYHKETGEIVTLTTEEFDTHYYNIGTSGKYADYIIDGGPNKTFQYTRAGLNGENYFQEGLAERMSKAVDRSWQGPFWNSFVESTSTEESARETLIITSRQHPPQHIHEGTQWLVEQGYIKNAIPEGNIWTVNNADFAGYIKKRLGVELPVGEKISSAQRKAIIIKELLDDYAAKGDHVIFRFSDDSVPNMEKIAEAMIDYSHDPRFTLYFHLTAPHSLTQAEGESFQLLNGEKVEISLLQFDPNWHAIKYECNQLLYMLSEHFIKE